MKKLVSLLLGLAICGMAVPTVSALAEEQSGGDPPSGTQTQSEGNFIDMTQSVFYTPCVYDNYDGTTHYGNGAAVSTNNSEIYEMYGGVDANGNAKTWTYEAANANYPWQIMSIDSLSPAAYITFKVKVPETVSTFYVNYWVSYMSINFSFNGEDFVKAVRVGNLNQPSTHTSNNSFASGDSPIDTYTAYPSYQEAFSVMETSEQTFNGWIYVKFAADCAYNNGARLGKFRKSQIHGRVSFAHDGATLDGMPEVDESHYISEVGSDGFDAQVGVESPSVYEGAHFVATGTEKINKGDDKAPVRRYFDGMGATVADLGSSETNQTSTGANYPRVISGNYGIYKLDYTKNTDKLVLELDINQSYMLGILTDNSLITDGYNYRELANWDSVALGKMNQSRHKVRYDVTKYMKKLGEGETGTLYIRISDATDMAGNGPQVYGLHLYAYDVVEYATISLNANEYAMWANDEHILTATVSKDLPITWNSSDENVVTVDASGKVTAVGSGTAIITATVTENGRTIAANCVYTVTDYATITLSEESHLIEPEGNHMLVATVSKDLPIAWSSSDENVVTVDASGRVTAVGAGSATVTAAITENGKTITAACEYTVAEYATIVLGETSHAMWCNEDHVLSATVSKNLPIVWTSSDENVVTVDENGYVLAVGGGVATVTATVTDFGKTITATCEYTVTAYATLSLNEVAKTLKNGESHLLNATVSKELTVAWSSSDENIITVDATGKVTAVGIGEATVTATVTENGKETKASCAYTVEAADSSENSGSDSDSESDNDSKSDGEKTNIGCGSVVGSGFVFVAFAAVGGILLAKRKQDR